MSAGTLPSSWPAQLFSEPGNKDATNLVLQSSRARVRTFLARRRHRSTMTCEASIEIRVRNNSATNVFASSVDPARQGSARSCGGSTLSIIVGRGEQHCCNFICSDNRRAIVVQSARVTRELLPSRRFPNLTVMRPVSSMTNRERIVLSRATGEIMDVHLLATESTVISRGVMP